MSLANLMRSIGAAVLVSFANWQPASAATADPNEYHWWQERGFPTVMGSVAGRACFLTRMTGNFEGGGEYIHVVARDGFWYLTGHSLQEGVGASARCVDQVQSNGVEY